MNGLRLKQKAENYMLQIGSFVFDYIVSDGLEKIVVAKCDNLSVYSIYNYVNNQLNLAFTTMTDNDIESYMPTLYRNYSFIIQTGREDTK